MTTVMQSLQQVHVDGAILEYRMVGSGEPVVLVHGSHIADAVMPLLGEPTLTNQYQLISYHRRGFAGSTHSERPVSVAEHAADCHGVMRALGIDRAHVVGYSFGGVITLQLALDAPSAVHSLAVLEPPLLFVPSAREQMGPLGAAMGLYQAGDRAGAVDTFMRTVVGSDYRAALDRVLPAALEQAVRDADTFFQSEFLALPQWRFTREDAGRITQPTLAVLGSDSPEISRSSQEAYDLLLDWLPNVEGSVLPGSTHSMPMQNPRGLADVLAAFIARNPL